MLPGQWLWSAFVVDASDRAWDFHADLDPARDGVPADAFVHVTVHAPDGGSRGVLSEATGVVPLKGTLPARDVIMFRLAIRQNEV